MRGFVLGLSVSVAFIAGSLVGSLGSSTVNAQSARPTRWSHQCVAERAGSARGWARDVTEIATRMGAEGWEMQTIDGTVGVVCFKRPR